MRLGWQVLDPEGNVIDSGDVTVIEVDVEQEMQQRRAELAEEAPTWQE